MTDAKYILLNITETRVKIGYRKEYSLRTPVSDEFGRLSFVGPEMTVSFNPDTDYFINTSKDDPRYGIRKEDLLYARDEVPCENNGVPMILGKVIFKKENKHD